MPAVALFGLAAGAAAAAKGVSAFDFAVMNVLVFAGMSQMVALESWPEAWTLPALLATAAVTAVVNARLMLMSAGLRPVLAPLGARRAYPVLFLLTDASYVVAERERRAELDAAAAADPGGAAPAPDLGPFVGACLALWVAWVAAGALGHAGAALIGEPRAFALDLVVPAMFTALGVPLVARAPRLAPFALAALVALAAERLGGGHAALLAGALAGVALAAWRE